MPSFAILSRFGVFTGHQAAMVGADVPHADVISHNKEDVRFFGVLREAACYGGEECGGEDCRQK